MPRSPAFELFEMVCQELVVREATILPEDDVPAQIIEHLKNHYDETGDREAFKRAIQEIGQHFARKGSRVPFQFDETNGQFTRVDDDYVTFVASASNRRGLGGADSKNFEIQAVHRLAKRLTGGLHRVGVPRDQNKNKAEFIRYLQGLGFEKDCLRRRDKDGGLDILWLPPLGGVPLRPVVSFQCKNAFFDEDDAQQSAGRALRTLTHHTHVRGGNLHLLFVVFNDYVDDTFLDRASGWSFLPLGLSDLGSPVQPIETQIL